VIFQRIVIRLQRGEPRQWVLKGGMALEVRLQNAARLTKDVDLGLRDQSFKESDLRDRLVELLGRDVDRDGFVFAVGRATRMADDGGGHATWRVPVDVELAGRHFGSIKLDVSPRAHELDATDIVPLPNSLAFAGLTTVDIEIIEVHRHAAEKLHAMLQIYGERENSRVRDLVDLMLLSEHGLLSTSRLADAVTQVWAERDAARPPVNFPELPTSWPAPYERLAAEHDVEPSSFQAAAADAALLWAAMFPTEET
jgi:predicted nucleotidyltransferase component of viral defense system